MKILVTGASGFIGSAFCGAATGSGHDVVALVRPRPGGAPQPAAATVLHARIPFQVPARAWEGVEAVVHCAGATTGQDAVESAAVTVEGTRELLEESVARGVSRFVFLSSQSAHEGAVSAYGKTKLEAERLIRASGLSHAILRPGLVFGPGAAGLFARMRNSVRKLPVIPLLGGGIAIVQPIEVGDLCEAMLRCLALPAGENAELNLGDPDGMTLRMFLRATAVADTGRRKPELVIPLGPVKAVVRIGEALRIPLPISMDNLRGLEKVQRMETRESLDRIGLSLKPFAGAMVSATKSPTPTEPRPGRPARVLLVGAGKIGIVHGLNLFQREGAALCGIVDRNRRAFGLYRSMGFDVPFRTDLDAAIAELKPDAALIATPAATHVPLARQCLSRGLAVLVEKPAAFQPGLVAKLRALQEEFAPAPCHTGYMAAQFPQLDVAREAMESGEIGRPLGVWVKCLQSHIMASSPVRWEMVRAQSGGGVLINFAGHWVAVMRRLLGAPRAMEARAWPIHSAEVEDAFEARFEYGAFRARLFACWSAPGYARPHNSLVVEGDAGRLVVDQAHVSVLRDGVTESLWTQLDFPTGYNSAPDYTGAGFSMEHENFARAVRAWRDGAPETAGDEPPSRRPVDFAEAADAEEMIFALYDAAAGRETGRSGSLRLFDGPDAPEPDRGMDALIARLGPGTPAGEVAP